MEIVERATDMLFTLTVVLALGVIAARLAEKLKIPDVVFLLLTGVLVGPVLGLIVIPVESLVNQTILLGGAAYILFHGGTTINIHIISRAWLTIVLLATVGVLVTASLVGLTAASLLALPFMVAFLLASVIAPTDPATLIPVFEQVKVRPKVAQTVVSESTFNDATAASVVFVLAPVTLGLTAFSVGNALSAFLMEAGLGLGIGLLFGFLYVLSVTERYRVAKRYASKLSVVVGLFSFVVADLIGGSGFMAAFVAGLIVGNSDYVRHPISDDTMHRVHNFMDSNAAILRIFIFILLGAQVSFELVAQFWWQSLIIVGVLMFVARPLTVLICALPNRGAGWEWRELLFVFWVRETGVIPAALAGVLVAMAVPSAQTISSVVFMAVLVTILLQASTTRFVASRLGLLEHEEEVVLEEAEEEPAPAPA